MRPGKTDMRPMCNACMSKAARDLGRSVARMWPGLMAIVYDPLAMLCISTKDQWCGAGGACDKIHNRSTMYSRFCGAMILCTATAVWSTAMAGADSTRKKLEMIQYSLTYNIIIAACSCLH